MKEIDEKKLSEKTGLSFDEINGLLNGHLNGISIYKIKELFNFFGEEFIFQTIENMSVEKLVKIFSDSDEVLHITIS